MVLYLPRAATYAITAHGAQQYGTEPYVRHLCDVVVTMSRFWPAAPNDLIDAAWLHDVVEDTPITIGVLRAQFGDRVADLVDAVTQDKHDTRSTRVASTFPKIRRTHNALTLKLADRISNVEHCIRTFNEKLLKRYVDEHKQFQLALMSRCSADSDVADPMWEHLCCLIRGCR